MHSYVQRLILLISQRIQLFVSVYAWSFVLIKSLQIKDVEREFKKWDMTHSFDFLQLVSLILLKPQIFSAQYKYDIGGPGTCPPEE